MAEHDGSGHPEVQHVTIHGHRRAFVRMGTGPVLLLLHGMACNHTTWHPVIARLARRYTVIAPDLLGHGQSDKPRADYSVAGYANAMRDLLTVLGVDRVTVVGHSLGGGVAMQFAYQFPERTERLVLVAPGGIGPEVTPVIRAVTMPGFHTTVGLLTMPVVREMATGTLRALSRHPARLLRDLDEIAAILDELRDRRARSAFRHVVRCSVDLRGQVVTMADRAYLTAAMPICVVWGAHDRVIPAKQAARVAELAPGARVEIFDDAGHFPHKDHPEAFVGVVEDFLSTTAPAVHHRGRWRALLKSGASARPEAQASVAVVA